MIATLIGLTASSALAGFAVDVIEEQVMKFCVAEGKSLWHSYKLNSFVRNTIVNVMTNTPVHKTTRTIIEEKEKKYKPIKEKFVLSIFRRTEYEPDFDEVKKITVIDDLTDRVTTDLKALVDSIRVIFWNNEKFNELVSNEDIQQMLMDEIDKINKKLAEHDARFDQQDSRMDEHEARMEKYEAENKMLRAELEKRKFTLVENVPGTVAYFTGRDADLGEIFSKLSENRMLFLTGFGGVGKTELAMEFATRFKKNNVFNRAVWVTYDGDMRSTIANGIKYTDIDESCFDYDVDAVFKAKMAALSHESNLLLIIDNYVWNEDVDEIRGLQCKTILTTRSTNIPSEYSIKEVTGLSEEESYRLILKLNEKRSDWIEKHQMDIMRILRDVGCHTLTVALLAGVIKETADTDTLDLSKGVFDIGEGELSENKLKEIILKLFNSFELSPEEIDILRVASLLPVEGVEYNLFMKLSDLPEEQVGMMLNSNLLTSYDSGGKRYISMHPLMKEIIRSEYPLVLNDSGNKRCLLFLLNFRSWLMELIEGRSPKEMKRYEKLFSSIGEFVLTYEPEEGPCCVMVRGILAGIATVYEIIGLYGPALDYYQNDLWVKKEVTPSGDPEMAEIYNAIGLLNGKLAHYSDALDYSLKALELNEKYLSPDDPDIANTYCNIGLAYKRLAQYDKALLYYKKSIEIYEKTPSDHGPELVTVYYNIGSFYNEFDENEKALEYTLKSLKICENLPYPDPEELAGIHNNLGNIYGSLQEYDKAIEHLEIALQIRNDYYSNHPDVAMFNVNLGIIYGLLGEYDKALKHCEAALKIFTAMLRPDHPNLAELYINIGSIYAKIQNYDEAIKYYLKAQKIIESSHIPDSPFLVSFYFSLGFALMATGRYEEAGGCFTITLDMQERLLSPEDPDLALTYLQLGVVCTHLSDYDMALDCFSNTLELINKMDPPGDSELMSETYREMAITYRKMGKRLQAMKYDLKAKSHRK